MTTKIVITDTRFGPVRPGEQYTSGGVGNFAVNGVFYTVPVGMAFDADDAILEAIKNANIKYVLASQFGGGGSALVSSAATFMASVSAGALIAALNNPFEGATTYSAVGTIPAQLAVTSSGQIVRGLGAIAPGSQYTVKIRATSADDKREVAETFTFTAQADATAPTLGTVSFSGALEINKLTSGIIVGANPNSLLESHVPGIVIDNLTRTYSGTPTGSPGAISNAITETLDGAVGSPKDSPVTIAPSTTLGLLDLDGVMKIGELNTFTILGWTAGSVITSTIPGMDQPVFASGVWTISGTPGGSSGTVTGGLVETLDGYTNSPKPSDITVQAPTLGTLTFDQNLVLGNATTGMILGATVGSTIAKKAGSNPGLTINSSMRTFIWAGTGSAGTISDGLTETLLGATGSPKPSPVVIQPAPIAPTISLSPITAVAEGSSGAPGDFTITATRSTSSGPASVNWTVSAGFAGNPVNAADFGGSFPTGVIYFPDGQSSMTATFTVAGDSVVEPDETGIVTLSSPSSPYELATSVQNFLVVNDDSYPTMSLNTIAPRAEGSSAFPAVVNISVVRSTTTGAASCLWAVTAGGGSNPLSAADFQGGAFPSGTLSWLDGQTTASASFTMVGDSVVEPDETGIVTISSPSAGYVIGTAQQPFIIQDDDAFQPLAAPVLSGLGASRVRQSVIQSGSLGANLSSNHVTGGMLSWIQALDPRYAYTNWIEQTNSYMNSYYHDGLTFASDGEGFPQMRRRVPKLRSTRANIVMMDLSSNSVNGTYNLTDYCNQAKELITLMRAVGKVVGVLALTERVTTTGGPWASGQAWRLGIPAINAEMQSWCATQQGVFFVDVRSVLVDLTTTDHEPLSVANGNAYDATRDGTHWSQRGAYEGAKKFIEAAQPYIASGAVEASRQVSGGSNKYSNGNFAGSNAITATATLSGVQPNNCTIGFGSGNGSVVVASLVDRGGGKFGVRLTINRSGMSAGVLEVASLTMNSGFSGITAGKWYTGSIKATTNNAPGLATPVTTELSDSSTKAARGMSGINGGGSAVVINYVADLAGEVRTMKAETPSLKANTSTAANFIARCGWGKGDGSVLVVDLFDPMVIEVDDPHLLMFDPSDVSTPTITSNSAFSFPEESSFSMQGTSSKPGYWSLTGADAAQFSVDPWGLMTVRAPLDYENPADADKDNVYSWNLVLTPYDIRDSVVTKAMTQTTTDIDDGFSDSFTGTVNGPVTQNSAWIPTGSLRSLNFVIGSGQRVSIVDSGVADKANILLAPRQLKDGSPNYEQRISFNRGAISTSFPSLYIQYKDSTNYIAVRANANGVINLYRRNGASEVNIATYTFDDTYGVNFIVQRLGNEIQMFQGRVRLVPTSGSESVGTILQDAYDSGMGGGGAAQFFFAFWNNRNATPIVSRIGLKKLTAAVTTISVADAAATGIPLNNLTENSARSVKSVTGTGSANASNVSADGNNVKIKEGTAGETYTITVTEVGSDPTNTNPAAGRDSALATVTLTA